MANLMKRLWTEEEGASSVEYGLIAALVAVALIAAFTAFRGEISLMFRNAGDTIDNNT